MIPAPPVVIEAAWDDEAKVWVATSDDVPGLATEAASVELLTHKLSVLVPELLQENCPGRFAGDIPVEIKTSKNVKFQMAS